MIEGTQGLQVDSGPASWRIRALAAERLAQREREQASGDRFAVYRTGPARYAAEVLKVRWWSKQIELAESVRLNRRTACYAGHAVGKTHLMAGIAQWCYDCFNPSITLSTAPNWSSIHDLLWAEIKSQRPRALPGRLLDLSLGGGMNEPMHYVAGHNAESSSGFQGRHEARVTLILDEAMGCPPWIWEGVNAMMTSPECRVVAIGNPTETSGDFFEVREDPDWNVIILSCLDHPNIAAELVGQAPPYPKAVSLTWVREMLDKHTMPVKAEDADADAFEFPPGSGQWHLPDDVFRCRVMGLFPRQAANSIWSEAWLKTAREASSHLEWSPDSVPQIGVDVARWGDDRTTLYGRRGPKVLCREAYAKQGLMETTGRVVAMATRLGKQHNVHPKKIGINVDDTGLGGGVTDRLIELGYNVYGVNFGTKADDDENYANTGSEMWFAVAELARLKKLDLSALEPKVYRQLSAELRARQYKIQSDKTLRAESKTDIKKRLKRSPDDADGLCLAFKPLRITARVLDMDDLDGQEDTPTPTPAKKRGHFTQQVRNAFPQGFEKPAKGEVCGNCTNFTKRSDGKGFCKERQLLVDAPDTGCEFFDFDDITELYQNETGDADSDDDE